MSLLSQFYPSGGGTDWQAFYATGFNGYPSVVAVGGSIDVIHTIQATEESTGDILTVKLNENLSRPSVRSLYTFNQFREGLNDQDAPTAIVFNHCYGRAVRDSISTSKTKSIVLNHANLEIQDGVTSAGGITEFFGKGNIISCRIRGTDASFKNLTHISQDIALNPRNDSLVGGFAFKGTGLDAESVSHLLVSAVKNGAEVSLSGSNFDLSGGTAAGLSSLTPDGATARDRLISAGVTVTLNA